MLNLDTRNDHPRWETALPGPDRLAVDLCAYHEIQLRPEGRALLKPELGTQEYFELLLANGCYADARRVLAHALPKRRALWWGSLCAWDVYRPQPLEKVARVLQSVTRFVHDPSEDNRQATADCAREIEANSVAACLGMAAFCSDGSLAGPGLPCVPPKPFITGRLVGVTVYLASVLRDPTRYKDYLRQYLDLGVEVALGRNLWTVSTAVLTECKELVTSP
jgi:hypothetical protein